MMDGFIDGESRSCPIYYDHNNGNNTNVQSSNIKVVKNQKEVSFAIAATV